MISNQICNLLRLTAGVVPHSAFPWSVFVVLLLYWLFPRTCWTVSWAEGASTAQTICPRVNAACCWVLIGCLHCHTQNKQQTVKTQWQILTAILSHVGHMVSVSFGPCVCMWHRGRKIAPYWEYRKQPQLSLSSQTQHNTNSQVSTLQTWSWPPTFVSFSLLSTLKCAGQSGRSKTELSIQHTHT